MSKNKTQTMLRDYYKEIADLELELLKFALSTQPDNYNAAADCIGLKRTTFAARIHRRGLHKVRCFGNAKSKTYPKRNGVKV